MVYVNLTKQLAQLSVKIANNKPKRSQPTEEQHNGWCHNCEGQGHLANECPTPKEFKTRCILCEGSIAVQECWNLKQQKIVNQANTDQSCPWQQEGNGLGPSANYIPKRNFNRRPISLNFQGCTWNQQNNSSNWNVPSFSSKHFKRFDWNQDDPRKFFVWYQCKELGHYANNCPKS